MKLYATTTSERASKSQGGNRLEITVQNEERDILVRVEIHPNDQRRRPALKKYSIKIIDGDPSFLRYVKSAISLYLWKKDDYMI